MEWAQFIGRFHPVVLHLPIGLFPALFTIELIGWYRRGAGVERCALVLVWLMALTSALAAFFGLLLGSNGDYSGETYDRHKCLGIIFAVLTLFLAFFRVLAWQSSKFDIVLYRLLMLGLLVLLPAVGHYGGHLTHGVGYLTHYAPDWPGALLGDESEAEIAEASEGPGDVVLEGNLFVHQIRPIFEQYCIECHGPEKQKSRYRMDTYEYLMTPGSTGDTPVEPGGIARSVVLEYMLLPETEDMAMPPEGKPRPSVDEILLIAHRIAAGAEGPPVDEAALAAEQAAIEAKQAKLEVLFQAGIVLLPIGQDSDLLYLDLQNAREAFTDDVLKVLALDKNRIYELKLRNHSDALAVLQALEGATELRKLNLSGLQNAEAAIDLVNSFDNPEMLNLFGSDLTCLGLPKLSLPNLRSLYLGGTQVSAEQLADYARAVPEVEVVGDVDLASVEAIKATDAANTSEFNPQAK